MTMQTILIWLLGGLVGSMLFFAITVAPTVFKALPAEHAGKFLRRFFPHYYLWGLVMAIICTLVSLTAGASQIVVAICALVTIMFIYARQFLMPRINRARDQGLDGDATAGRHFKWLHLQSVLINGLQLVLLIAATVYLAMT